METSVLPESFPCPLLGFIKTQITYFRDARILLLEIYDDEFILRYI